MNKNYTPVRSDELEEKTDKPKVFGGSGHVEDFVKKHGGKSLPMAAAAAIANGETATLNKGCGGCNKAASEASADVKAEIGIIGKIANAASSLKDVVTTSLGINAADAEEIARRRNICFFCDAVDSEGKRLFRVTSNGPVCGKLFTEKPLRDPKIDGCGCYLLDKHKGKDNHCPLEKW